MELKRKMTSKVANVVSSTLCALKGTAFLRVHDVGITKDAILIVNKAKSV
jgi:dihydropteroate synthase